MRWPRRWKRGSEEASATALRGPVRERVERVKDLMVEPQYVNLDQASWLELVASVHYLQKVRGMSETAADQELERAKPQLAEWTFAAREELKQHGLLS